MPDAETTQHTCSRGHTYSGPGPCPTCWPSGHRRTVGRARGRTERGNARAGSRRDSAPPGAR